MTEKRKRKTKTNWVTFYIAYLCIILSWMSVAYIADGYGLRAISDGALIVMFIGSLAMFPHLDMRHIDMSAYYDY